MCLGGLWGGPTSSGGHWVTAASSFVLFRNCVLQMACVVISRWMAAPVSRLTSLVTVMGTVPGIGSGAERRARQTVE